MIQPDVLASVALVAIILYYLTKKWATQSLPLPPGPKKLPLIGNLRDIPTSLEWETYHKWCKKFDSDIIHLDVAGTSIIVLDTFEAVTDLLEKRSSQYSGRARLPMLNELMGWDWAFGTMPYGDHWRHHYRLMHQEFRPTAALQFRPHELKATQDLLRRLLNDSSVDGFMGHLRHMAGETIISIAYGLEVLPKDDPFIQGAEAALRTFSLAAMPGTFLVDMFPILKVVPDWMPFADFKRKAKAWRKLALAMVEGPFEAAKRNIEKGGATPSFTSLSLENMDTSGDLGYQETVIKNTAGTMYTAGTDSTVSTITTCVLGLITRPEVLRKAQQEIDAVLGLGQLPDFEDEESLPYITAIVKETMRWREVTPIAIPHLASNEDEYKGYRIPAGSIVIPNTWAILHDEAIYPDPFTFNPDRFMKDGKLNAEILDPALAAFGYGRRICPGRYMAYSSVWIAIASLIAAFDITKPLDENGQVIEPSQEYQTDLICIPLPFKCSFKPRSKEVEDAIRATYINEPLLA